MYNVLKYIIAKNLKLIKSLKVYILFFRLEFC